MGAEEIPPDLKIYAEMMAAWGLAAAGQAKEQAWRAVITWLVKNPRVYQFIGARIALQDVVAVAVERELLRAFAARGVQRGMQRAAGSGARLFAARLALNLGVGPKVPVPVVQLAITVGITVITVAEAGAETAKMNEKFPEYRQYLLRYMEFAAKAAAMHPHVMSHLAQPKDFPEWYAENQPATAPSTFSSKRTGDPQADFENDPLRYGRRF